MVLVAITLVAGYITPRRAIAKELVKRGYDVSRSDYGERIKETRATCMPLSCAADLTEVRIKDILKSIANDKPPSATKTDQEVWIEVIPDQ